jgi:hypothetical protein
MAQPIPTLLEHLISVYKTDVSDAERSLDGFAAFAHAYLLEHRVVENWAEDMNLGIRLMSNKSSQDMQGLQPATEHDTRVIICPPTAEAQPGEMMPTGDVVPI